MDYFPQIYKDELLYSVIARYHEQCGNTNLRKTIKDISGIDTQIANLEFPSSLDRLANILSDFIDVNAT